MNSTLGEPGIQDEATVATMRENLRAASHDIRQPVAAVLALVEAARQHPETTPVMRGYLDAILHQAVQISETTRAVLDVDWMLLPESVPVRLDEAVSQALRPFRLTWEGALHQDVPDGPLHVLGDPGLLRRSLVNVVENATRAAGAAGTVWVRVQADRFNAVVEVEDDGPGFGNIASGTGIGLAQTQRVLSSMGGCLVVAATCSAGGARVLLRMPLLQDQDAMGIPQARAV